MPAPDPNRLIRLSIANFRAKGIHLPIDWRDMGAQFPNAFLNGELKVAPNSAHILFREPTLNKYHVETSRLISQLFEDYIKHICRAICQGLTLWLRAATVVNVKIVGSVGLVRSNNYQGPNLTPLIYKYAPRGTPQERRYSHAIASAIASAWHAWHTSITGLMVFPSLPYHSGYNVPIPLIAFSAPGEAELAPHRLSADMRVRLKDRVAFHSEDLFDALSKGLYSVFQQVKLTTVTVRVYGNRVVGNGGAGCLC